MSRVSLFLALSLALITTSALSAQACDPDGTVRFVCGTTNPEDLYQIPGTPWVIASGRYSDSEGPLYAVDTRDHSAQEIFPAGALAPQHDRDTYRACPGPNTVFQPHGLTLREGGGSVHTLYVVGHGAREAIEVFELDASGTLPTMKWVGCIPAPNGTRRVNSITALPDGYIGVTNFDMFFGTHPLHAPTRRYQDAIRVFPQYVDAHMSMGHLLLRDGRLLEAQAYYQSAAEIDPGNAEAHVALGNVANTQGHSREAVSHYRVAVDIEPWVPEAHFSLARSLISLGEADEAVDHLEQAARVAPLEVAPRIAAGWVLAADPDPVVRHPQLAIRVGEGLESALGRNHPLVLDLLAAAHAAAGDFGGATRLAERAVGLATSSGDEALGRSISERVGLYREGQPFLTKVGPYARAPALD